MLAIGVLGAILTPPAGVVLFGPGSNEVKLITAKLAARAGFSASYICGAGEEQTARALLYAFVDSEAGEAGLKSLTMDESGVSLQEARERLDAIEPGFLQSQDKNAQFLKEEVALVRDTAASHSRSAGSNEIGTSLGMR